MSTDNLDASLVVRLFTAGSAACIADLITFPLDTAKVRLQLQGEIFATEEGLSTRYRGLFDTIQTIVRQEGPKALYNGVTAGLQRQMCFASVRLGLYDHVKSMYQIWFNQSPESLNVLTRIMAGVTTGTMAVTFAQPTEVVKIRFQAQNKLIETRYTSTFGAYREIAQQEGVQGLWKGAFPNLIRSSIVNVAEIVCYDLVKQLLIQSAGMKDNILCHFSSAVVAGFATTVAASPIDVVKTRFMNSPYGMYTGPIDCASTLVRTEGLTAFYKGFVPSFMRLTMWNIFLWISYEQLKQILFTKTDV